MARPILIIEDDPNIAESLRFNLEREGLSTVTALTGEEGLAAGLNRENPPALIMLDLMLPGISGTELCRRFRRESQTILLRAQELRQHAFVTRLAHRQIKPMTIQPDDPATPATLHYLPNLSSEQVVRRHFLELQ